MIGWNIFDNRFVSDNIYWNLTIYYIDLDQRKAARKTQLFNNTRRITKIK